MDEKLKAELSKAWRDPAQSARRWKQKTGGKVIGLVLVDVPEEMVMAASALPTSLLGREVAFQHADRHLQGFACSYSRSVIELAEQAQLGYLDGLIMPYICDTTRCLDLIFKYLEKFAYYDCLRIPRREAGQGVEEYFCQELKRLGQSLGAFTGCEITDAGLAEAIRTCNRLRALLGQLRQGLCQGRDGVTAEDYLYAVRTAMVLPAHESEPLLKSAVESLGPPRPGDGRPRVVVAGKLSEPVGIVDLIERSGLAVVEDHLAVGSRWVEPAADESGDPWAALVKRQLRRLPLHGVWSDRPHRGSYLIERVKELGADGAVLLVQKFCEPLEIDYPGIREELEKQGIPLLALETDYQSASLEPVRTRVEAFAEMLKANRGSGS